MAAIIEASVNGIPLVFVVLGLVEYGKRLGLKDRALLLTSLAVGLVLGTAYQLTLLTAPLTPPQFFGVVVYGLMLGLLASGIYDVANGIFKKAVGR